MTDHVSPESLVLSEGKDIFGNQAGFYFHESLVGTRGYNNLPLLTLR